MSQDSHSQLRSAFLSGYGDLLKWLTGKLGSRESAEDALQDAYLRLERAPELPEVKNARAYLLRIALNSAHNRRRSERAHLSVSEGREFLDILDEQPTPEHTASDRSDIDALRRALADLPQRRRDIFLAAWGEGLSREEISARFGLAPRTVRQELTLAREHCAKRIWGRRRQ
jgi:RNA polymerase sigma factor (sigma-70 family)